MLIVCPSCATSYNVELASLQPNGRQVRCVRCRNVWTALPTQAQRLVAAAEALAPDRLALAAATQASVRAAAAKPPMAHAAGGSNETDWSLDRLPGEEAAEAAPDTPPDWPEPAPEAAGVAFPDVEPSEGEGVEAPPIAPAEPDLDRPPIGFDIAEPEAEPRTPTEKPAPARRRPGASLRFLRWPLSRLQNVILVLLIADCIIVGWRTDFVRVLPQTASLYAWMGLPVNVRGLSFDAVTINVEQHEGVPILVVDGAVVNGARQMADVPRLKFAVRNAAHQEIYSWTAVPPRSTLPPGEAVTFRTRLASPPPEARDVLVRFVNRRDMLAGSR